MKASNIELAQIPTATGEKYFERFRDYANKEEVLGAVHQAFFDGIELFAGHECRTRCQRDGLSLLHLHYPADRVALLESYVSDRVKHRVLEWSAAIGRRDVGFTHDFLVQDLLVVRVHYPHSALGKPAPEPPLPSLLTRLRYGFAAALERTREAYGSLSMLRLSGKMLTYVSERRKRAALPLPFRCHASHLDSWLGQPITALSVWLAIAGVDEDNGMCLYPDTIGIRLPVSGSRFLGPGYCLPKPIRPDLMDGDLFVFTTDMLHSSQLNISDKTRVALTTRIDPGSPIFSDDSFWFVERWFSADGILEGKWRKKVVHGKEHIVPRTGPIAHNVKSVEISDIFQVKNIYTVGPSQLIGENEKLAVQFKNKRVLIVRSGGQLRALSGTCPHGEFRMDDGYHDQCFLTCPGHGLNFEIATGKSALKRYRLAMFDVRETDGQILLGGLRPKAVDH